MSLIWIPLIVILLLILGLFAATVFFYEKYFTRFETADVFRRTLAEFPGLREDTFAVVSDRGQKLAASAYRQDGVEPRAVLLIAHGFGAGSHNGYLDLCAYFARQGFIVIGYDITGNDRSEGKSVRGLQQGYIDLAHVIRHVKNDPELAAYPLALFGHSWGGYSVGAALALEPDVDAVVAVSGFNEVPEIVEHFAYHLIGLKLIRAVVPFFKLYGKMKFGDRAATTAAEGFANSDAEVLILHSRDDEVVPVRCGYDIFQKKFGDDPRFTFHLFADRGHAYIYYTPESQAYSQAFFRAFKERFAGQKKAEDEKKAYLGRHFDRSRAWIPDEAVLSEITAFYENALKKA